MFKWFGPVSYTSHTKVADFAAHLRDGRLMGSRCGACGAFSFPPRADCPDCMSAEFLFEEVSGRGAIHTWTRIAAAPAGLEARAPYVIAVVDLEEGGRALAWVGDSIPWDQLEIGLAVQVVPCMEEEVEDIRVYFTLERPGTGSARQILPGG